MIAVKKDDVTEVSEVKEAPQPIARLKVDISKQETKLEYSGDESELTLLTSRFRKRYNAKLVSTKDGVITDRKSVV